MKKLKVLLMMGTLLLAMTACGTEEKERVSVEDIAGQNREEDLSGKDDTSGTSNTAEDGDNVNVGSSADTDQTNLSGIIEEQTFSTSLEGWGEVTFAPFLPEENENGNGDVQFKLLKDGEVLYEFPGVYADNILNDRQCDQVVAVAFKDYNDDALTDVITICKYTFVSGDRKDESYQEVRVYLQQKDSKEFVRDTLAAEFLERQHYNDSIDAVMAAKEEYQDYAASMDGSRSVAAQLEIIAENRDLWFEDPEYMDEIYQCAVTDLNLDGRMEIIVSSFGGSGSYTFSRFFEVNEGYDELTECTTNFMEGDSQADIMVDTTTAYYDNASGGIYYIFSDDLHVSAGENYENLRALTLQNGQVTEQYLAKMSEITNGETATVTFHDMDGNVIDETAYYAIPDKVFPDAQKYAVTFGWLDMKELVDLDDAALAKKLEESRDMFRLE